MHNNSKCQPFFSLFVLCRERVQGKKSVSKYVRTSRARVSIFTVHNTCIALRETLEKCSHKITETRKCLSVVKC